MSAVRAVRGFLSAPFPARFTRVIIDKGAQFVHFAYFCPKTRKKRPEISPARINENAAQIMQKYSIVQNCSIAPTAQ
jgi:hypothetical protein